MPRKQLTCFELLLYVPSSLLLLQLLLLRDIQQVQNQLLLLPWQQLL